MLPRACAASRTAIIASRSRPSAAGSMSAWKPRITPDCRRARTRARQVDGAMPTRSASALFGTRASTASSCRIARSTGSSGRRTLFGPSGIIDLRFRRKVDHDADSSESSVVLCCQSIARFFTLAVMRIGVPTEVKNREYRVALTPAGVHELVASRPRGARPGRRRAGQRAAGRRVRRGGRADRRRRGRPSGRTPTCCSRSRNPSPRSTTGCARARCSSPTCTWPPSRACTDALLGSGTTAIAYETVQLPDRSLPLLAPMSEVAGRLAPQVGAYHLMRPEGGRGVLMGGVPGVPGADVVVIGGGVAGPERRRDRPGHGRRGHPARREHRRAARDRRRLRRPGPDRRLERLRRRPRGASTPTSSSAPCSSPAPRRRSS